MSEFTAPTGERAEAIMKAARETLAAGQAIGSGAPELPEMKKRAGLEDITGAERDWAFEQIQAEQAAAAAAGQQEGGSAGGAGEGDGADGADPASGEGGQDADAKDDEADAQATTDPEDGEAREPYQGPPVHCAACDVDVDPEDLEGPTEEGKVYVNHHGAREGVPIPDEGPVVAFESMAG